jgi:hypothetical protein
MQWWKQKKHAAMVFPVVKIMEADLFNHLPDTSNAQESMHHVLYQILDRLNDLGFGFQLLTLFAEDLEEKYIQRKAGNSTNYGQSEYWKVFALRNYACRLSRKGTDARNEQQRRIKQKKARTTAGHLIR